MKYERRSFCALLLCMTFILIGCSKTEIKTIQKVQEESEIISQEAPDMGIEDNSSSKTFLCKEVSNTDERVTLFMGYTFNKKQYYRTVELMANDVWQFTLMPWTRKLQEMTNAKITDVVRFEKGYYGVIQRKGKQPQFLTLYDDGSIQKWKLPKDVLEDNEITHERVRWLTIDEKNQLVISTEYTNDNETSKNTPYVAGDANMIVFNVENSKVVSKRDCVGAQYETIVADGHVFAISDHSPDAIKVYSLDGGTLEMEIMTENPDNEFLSTKIGLCYKGGEYAYFYTQRGIYRFQIKKKYDGKEKLELVIPAENYIDKGEYSLNYFSYFENDESIEFYPVCTLHKNMEKWIGVYKKSSLCAPQQDKYSK